MIWNKHPEVLGHVGNVFIIAWVITGIYWSLVSGVTWYFLSLIYLHEKKESEKPFK